MSSSRRTFLSIVVAAAAIGGAILAFGTGKVGVPALPGFGKDPVTVTVASAVTKQKWLEAARETFLAGQPTTSTGQPIRIELSSVLSGDSMEQIASGALQPVVWSPGEFTWVEQLEEKWHIDHSTSILSAPCQPTVLTPVGLAMWRPMAEALGWPDKKVSLRTLVDLANDPQGWATYGHPEWGRLRLGHTHPQYSSAGLLYLASVVYAITGKTEGITAQDIYAPEVIAALTTLEQNTAKYGMVTTDLLTSMANFGPGFLHVTSAFEEGAVRFNVERGGDLRWPLAFLFPAEGTFWSPQPYCILDKSGWVSPEQAEAAKLFLDHLRAPAMQATAGHFFVRPLDPATPLGDRLTLANGTDPQATPQTVPDLEIPSPEISKAIIDLFKIAKRKATAVIVLDTSGSMNEGGKFVAATKATEEFLGRFDRDDRLGIVSFNSTVSVNLPITPLRQMGESAANHLPSSANYQTALFDGMCRAAELIREAQTADRAAGDNRLYGIVLLSDGQDTASTLRKDQMLATCLGADAEAEAIKVFAIGFGDDADKATLAELAARTQGAAFFADPKSIRTTYLKISAEQ